MALPSAPAPAPTPNAGPPSAVRRALRARGEQVRYTAYLVREAPLTLVGGALVLLYVLMAVFAPLLAPPNDGWAESSSPYDLKPFSADEAIAPSATHPLGTTEFGGDLWHGIVWGARVSMAMGVGITLGGALVGLVLGLVAGYFGGWLDDVIMRVTDVFLSLPVLILAMAIAISFGRSLENVALALLVLWWPTYTRIIRGQVLALRENQYVEAARAVGLSETRIMFRHVLPNAIQPIIVQATLDVGSVVLTTSALAFIGFTGTATLFSEWGSLVSIGQQYLETGQWWTVTFPGLAIFGFVLGFNLLGDGLRDILDPRLKK
ncbi:MAG: ABC transporter permease [Thermoplasmatota archaeon]